MIRNDFDILESVEAFDESTDTNLELAVEDVLNEYASLPTKERGMNYTPEAIPIFQDGDNYFCELGQLLALADAQDITLSEAIEEVESANDVTLTIVVEGDDYVEGLIQEAKKATGSSKKLAAKALNTVAAGVREVKKTKRKVVKKKGKSKDKIKDRKIMSKSKKKEATPKGSKKKATVDMTAGMDDVAEEFGINFF